MEKLKIKQLIRMPDNLTWQGKIIFITEDGRVMIDDTKNLEKWFKVVELSVHERERGE